jgi:hypothetical protein
MAKLMTAMGSLGGRKPEPITSGRPKNRKSRIKRCDPRCLAVGGASKFRSGSFFTPVKSLPPRSHVRLTTTAGLYYFTGGSGFNAIAERT